MSTCRLHARAAREAGATQTHLLNFRLAGKAVEELVKEDDVDEEAVLVEEVQDHVCQAVVRPVPVDQEELDEEAELRNGKVAGHDGLHALLAGDADANVSHLDHADVIRAVAWKG